MARDASGTWSRAVTPPTNGDVTNATDYNTDITDLGSEITASLEASGKKTWTGNQNANGYGIKSLLNTKVHTTGGGTTAYTVTTGASLASIATMPLLFIKMNATNTGASTLNVDGIGATAIKKNGTTALSASDLLIDYVYCVLYDGTNWQLLNISASGGFQPLDATLTALAALSWSSLTPLLQFTAADTVSLTSAPKITTLELGDATDTTLSRSSAGVAAIEGSALLMASNVASTANILANTADKIVDTDGAWAAAGTVALTDAATVAVDMSAGINFTLTIGGNRTLGQPSNQKVGQSGFIQITQDGTGSRTLAYHADWKFAGGTDPVLSTPAASVDVLFYTVTAANVVVASLIKAVA